MHGEAMAIAVGQVLRSPMPRVTGRLATSFDYVDIPFQTPPTRDALQEVLKATTGNPRQPCKTTARDPRSRRTDPRPLPLPGRGLAIWLRPDVDRARRRSGRRLLAPLQSRVRRDRSGSPAIRTT